MTLAYLYDPVEAAPQNELIFYETDASAYAEAYEGEPRASADLLAIAPIIALLLIGASLLINSLSGTQSVAVPAPQASGTMTQESAETAPPPITINPPTTRDNPAPTITDPTTFVAPYDSYVITQGMHGFSYGHAAIDIAAGKGATLKSSIGGTVTAKYTDGVGNPVLVIENDVYKLTLLHGIYTVSVGDQVEAGQIIGEESNIGNVTDMQGNSCRNRDCGYHSHLNVFDKRLGQNVNPLELLK
jgi:murein DD-endopeptidase MepM/ murein hydrolase activator NlpD